MMWTPWHDLRVRSATIFAFVAVVVTVASGASAFRDDVVVPAPAAGAAPVASLSAAHRGAAGASLAALDPFGAADQDAPMAASAPDAAEPLIVLVGTFIGVEQPAAVCRLGAGAARILHVGDSLAGWRLIQVAPARATFIDANGARHELRLSPLGN